MKAFENKIVLVTGGTAGIGRATAVAFAAQGAKVVVAGRREREGEESVKRIQKAGGEGIFVQTDIASEEAVKCLVAGTLNRFGRLDIAFNNAGILGDHGPITDATSEGIDRTFAINVRGVALCMKYELRAMVESGGSAIINNASVLGIRPVPNLAIYNASKFAVIGLTKTAALETFPERLAARGYAAVAFGKTHSQDRGYRHFAERGGVEGFGTPNGGYNPAQGPIVGVFPGPIEDQHDLAACRQFDAWLDQMDQPFVAHIGIMAPHPPLFPPTEFAGIFPRDQVQLPDEGTEEEKTKMHRHISRQSWQGYSQEERRELIGAYLDMAAYADFCLGEIIASLQRRNLLDDTIVVVTSDHGEMLGEHGLIGKWFSLYDDTLRIPMVLRLPGAQHAGLRLTQSIELIDLVPTLLELAGVDVPDEGWRGLSGRSFAGLFDHPNAPHRDHIVAMTENGWAIRTPEYKMVIGAERPCRGYSRELFSNEENQLFDLQADPGERVNLWESEPHAAIRADLAVRLVQHMILHRSSLSEALTAAGH